MNSPKPDLSNRDFFAALFLQGLLSSGFNYREEFANIDEVKEEEERQRLRDLAIDHADKLIVQLKENDEQ